MTILLYLFLSTLLLSLKCTAQNRPPLCIGISSHISCTCSRTFTQLELEDDHDGFFQDAHSISITNCALVHLTPPSLVNAEQLQTLTLANSGEVILDTEFPRSFSNLVIVNVTSLVKLHKPLFNRRQHMKILRIQNTSIKEISKHTFSELRVEHIEFLNSTFYNLTEHSILISDKQIQSAVQMPFNVTIKDCKFTDIPSNSISFVGASEVKIENVTFAGALSKTAMFINATRIYFMKNNIAKMQNNSLNFNLGYVKSFMFQENVLPCHCTSKCEPQTKAVIQNVELFEKTYQGLDFNLCSKVQNNFCSQNNSLSHIIQLQKQCGNTHLYDKLKQLNCPHSENDTKKCRNRAYTKSASLGFTLLAIALKRLVL